MNANEPGKTWESSSIPTKDQRPDHPGAMRPQFMIMMIACLLLLGFMFRGRDPELSTKFFLCAVLGLIPLALGQWRIALTSLPGWARPLNYGLFGLSIIAVLAMIARGNDIELGTKTWGAIALVAVLSNALAIVVVKLCFGIPEPDPHDEVLETVGSTWDGETVG